MPELNATRPAGPYANVRGRASRVRVPSSSDTSSAQLVLKVFDADEACNRRAHQRKAVRQGPRAAPQCNSQRALTAVDKQVGGAGRRIVPIDNFSQGEHLGFIPAVAPQSNHCGILHSGRQADFGREVDEVEVEVHGKEGLRVLIG